MTIKMLRTVVKQLTNILSGVASTATAATAPHRSSFIAVFSNQKALFHTTGESNANLNRYDRERDSVRQKGVDVNQTSPSSSSDAHQQISFNNKKSFGGVSFPTAETFSEAYDGVPFNQIPIIHIKATSNNTIVSVTDADGVVLSIQSAGTVGFRNARKGTNVAAQAAAIALADDALRKEVKQARVCVRGIGPGRFPALKAIEMSGIKVVSISDTTPLPHNGNRPKKVRRL